MSTVLKNRVGSPPATEVFEFGSETALIERDAELYQRVMERLANPSASIPAEDLLGSDEEEPAE